jgi:hypothetical protein
MIGFGVIYLLYDEILRPRKGMISLGDPGADAVVRRYLFREKSSPME